MSSSIISIQTWTTEQLNELQKLHHLCNFYDQINTPINYYMLKNRRQSDKYDFLYYIDHKLVGYLGLFIYMGDEAEISTIVHPEFRQQKIFTQLFTLAKQKLQSKQIQRAIFLTDTRSKSGKQVLQHLHTSYRESFYHMQHQSQSFPSITIPTSFSQAEPSDLDEWVQLEAKSFQESEEVLRYHILMFWNHSHHYHFKYSYSNKLVGKISVSGDETQAHIYGLCVDPEFQRKGIGKSLILSTLKQLQDQYTKFTLDVEISNKRAIKLYEKCGFQIIAKHDNYELSIS
ncbi:GNAT family N-acetyltransferase [Thermoflavimicrobium daqui]|nr:GNAT family N-acetyltransferase [Thermoflavimicrobium daqui]